MRFDEKLRQFQLAGAIVPDHSILKTPAQVDGIRKSAEINMACLDAVAKEIGAGMPTEDIDRIVYETTVNMGGIPAPLHYEGFPKSVCTSINEEVCHGIPDTKHILQEGDIINVDCSTILNGYFSDSSRMYCIGEVSPEKKRLVEVTKECVQIGLENVIPWTYLGGEFNEASGWPHPGMEELRELLGVPYEKQSDQLKAAFQKTFFCEETGLFTDSATSSHSALHSNVISCFYGLQPKNHRIIPFIREKGLCCGVYVAYFLLFALLKMGEKELAYELITNRTEHSWYQMIQEGATTAFEAWGKDQKWNTSLCHSWASAPIPVLMEMDLY
jgi:hypothetical protein